MRKLNPVAFTYRKLCKRRVHITWYNKNRESRKEIARKYWGKQIEQGSVNSLTRTISATKSA